MKNKSKINVRDIAYCGLLIAIGVILPQLFHIFGATAGKTLLPMHIPVILAGILVGPWYGLIVAVVVPILSSIFTGMPPVPLLYFMLFELAVYAVVSGIMSKKFNANIYLNLIVTLICGRLMYGLTLIVGVNLLGLRLPFGNVAAFFGGIITGLPGIAIQLIFIPAIVFALKKGGLVNVPARDRG